MHYFDFEYGIYIFAECGEECIAAFCFCLINSQRKVDSSKYLPEACYYSFQFFIRLNGYCMDGNGTSDNDRARAK
jgi:hypothetical protein